MMHGTINIKYVFKSLAGIFEDGLSEASVRTPSAGLVSEIELEYLSSTAHNC